MLAEELIGTEAKRESKQIVDSLANQLEAISTTANDLLQSSKVDVAPHIEIVDVPTPSDRQTAPEELVASAVTSQPGIREASAAAAAPQAPQRPAPEVKDLDTKLGEYYGVRQIADAVKFVSLYPRANDVQIAGDFNGWQPQNTPMKRVGDSGVWQAQMHLAQGSYRYRLVVDGQWQQDPYNEEMELNPFGEFNSVLEVK